MKTKTRSGLGRGLNSLIQTPREEDKEGLHMVAVGSIVPNPDQPRTVFDPTALTELAQSISAVGVLQPILVRPLTEDGDKKYGLIAGERRWRAAQEAGLTEIPAIVRKTDGQQPLEQALIENLQRRDLNPLEEGKGYSQLMEEYGLTHVEIAERVGKSRSAITNTIRLLKLAPEIQELLERGVLSAGHTRALLMIEDQAYAVHVAQRAAEEGWSVREVEEAARLRHPEVDPETLRVRGERPAAVVELEQRLVELLSTKVTIKYGARSKGRLEISFGSVEELESLYRRFFA